jgi:hypothetical protein
MAESLKDFLVSFNGSSTYTEAKASTERGTIYVPTDAAVIVIDKRVVGSGDSQYVGVKINNVDTAVSLVLQGLIESGNYAAYKATRDGSGNNIANTYATKEELEGKIAATDAMVLAGTVNGSGVIQSHNDNVVTQAVTDGTTLFTALTNYKSGWTWRVSGAGEITGIGKLQTGDMIICIKDYASSFKASDWSVVQNNVDLVTDEADGLMTAEAYRGITWLSSHNHEVNALNISGTLTSAQLYNIYAALDAENGQVVVKYGASYVLLYVEQRTTSITCSFTVKHKYYRFTISSTGTGSATLEWVTEGADVNVWGANTTGTAIGSASKPVYVNDEGKIVEGNSYTDTKNTTGATDTSDKIFLVGAKSQGANPQTFSHDTAYVGSDGHLYSNKKKVLNEDDTATAIKSGTIKVSSVNSEAVTVNSESTTEGRYYPVELNADGKAIVNVPWTDTDTNTDTKAKQLAPVTTNADYQVLGSYSANNTEETNSVRKSGMTYNPNTKKLSGPTQVGDVTLANVVTSSNYTSKIGVATDSKAGLMSADQRNALEAVKTGLEEANVDITALIKALTWE